MLVLSRKQGEQIHIGGNITVTVLGISRGVLKLGIEAPPKVRILRGELVYAGAPPVSERRRSRVDEPLMV